MTRKKLEPIDDEELRIAMESIGSNGFTDEELFRAAAETQEVHVQLAEKLNTVGRARKITPVDVKTEFEELADHLEQSRLYGEGLND